MGTKDLCQPPAAERSLVGSKSIKKYDHIVLPDSIYVMVYGGMWAGALEGAETHSQNATLSTRQHRGLPNSATQLSTDNYSIFRHIFTISPRTIGKTSGFPRRAWV